MNTSTPRKFIQSIVKTKVRSKLVLALLLTLALVLSQGAFVGKNKVSAACAPLATDKGYADTAVSVPTNGTYRVWSRVMAASSAENSYYLEVDGVHCGITVGDATIPANTWTWVDYRDGVTSTKIDLNLTAGTHTLHMVGREVGLKLDRVILTSNLSCIPSGNGDNCVTTTTPTPTPTPPPPTPPQPPDLIISSISQAPSNPYTNDLITFSVVVKNQGAGATQMGTNHGVQFKVDGQIVSWSGGNTSVSIAPNATITLTANNGPTNGTRTWKATVGTHTISAHVDDLGLIAETDNNNNITTETFVVNALTVPVPSPTPPNPNSAPPSTKQGDLNDDGKISLPDLSLLLAKWNRVVAVNSERADINNDGKVSLPDLSILLGRWGK